MQTPDFSAFRDIVRDYTTIQVKQRPDFFHFKLRITFSDGSILHVRENHLPILGWYEYSYQWLAADNRFIHRWDNAHERHSVNVPPHHQHIGSEENVHPSEPMTLEKVLVFIADRLTSS